MWHESASSFGTPDMIREWHQARGWRTLGYHGVITNGYLTHEDVVRNRRVAWLDGQFHVGRTFDGDGDIEADEVGAHAYGLNRESVGLCLIGQAGAFTVRQLRRALDVTQNWMVQFGIDSEHVIGHYEIGNWKPQFATTKTCPGIDMSIIREVLTLDAHIDDLQAELDKTVLDLAGVV